MTPSALTVPVVLDANALLAYVNREPGASHVIAAMTAGAVMHTVNWAEVLSKRTERGDDPQHLTERLANEGLLGQLVTIDPGAPADALAVAELHPLTRSAGLSLGDRYCLALAQRLGAKALTTDRTWASLNLGIEIEVIR